MLETTRIRALVVEDFFPFRYLFSSIPKRTPNVQVVGEVADGLEAVRLAEELKPDLIVLDIALSGIDGTEVAKRIRVALPDVRIIFATVATCGELVAEAMLLGASGYVFKTQIRDPI